MARSYRYLQYDVFTDRLFGGNQLAVFPDARGLADAEMQAIANEMNFSESTFVLPAEGPDTDVRMRIFTPGEELPMAGHPTIGTMFALVRTGLVAPPATRFVFGLPVGPVPVALTWSGADLTFAWMTQRLPVFGDPIDDARGVAAMLGLDEGAVRRSGLPAQVVSCGMPCLLVPIASRREVDEAVLDRPAWSRFTRSLAGAPDCVFFFTTEAGEDDATAYSRMFAPGLGIGEDPATGGASGPLGCYLVRHGAVTADQAAALRSLQGVKMGRPSHVHISIGLTADEISSVRVGGEAVYVGEGFLVLS
jgi:trans-2,3-dihydro-3-hydroxyanthranilate isomerase